MALTPALSAAQFPLVRKALEAAGALEGGVAQGGLDGRKLDGIAQALRDVTGDTRIGRPEVQALLAGWQQLSARFETSVSAHEARSQVVKREFGNTLAAGQQRNSGTSAANPSGPMSTLLAAMGRPRATPSAARSAAAATATLAFAQLQTGATRLLRMGVAAGALALGLAGPSLAQTGALVGQMPTALAAPAASASAATSARVARDTVVKDVVAQWTPGTQVYLTPDAPLSEQQQRHLGDGLKKFPNWTVVVVKSPGEPSDANKSWASQTAVALTDGLHKSAAFMGVRDASGQPSAHVLFWDAGARRIELSAAPQYEVLEKSFQNGGVLSQPFRNEMKKGGGNDGARALLNAIAGIEARIALDATAAAKASAATRTAALDALTTAHGQLAALTKHVDRVAGSVTGPIAQPNLAGFEAELARASTLADSADPKQAAQARAIAEKTATAVRAAQDALTAYPTAHRRSEVAQQRLNEHRAHPYAHAASAQIDAAQAAVHDAQAAIGARSADYLTKLTRAESATAAAGTAAADAQAAHERLVAQLQLAALALALGLAGAGALKARARARVKGQAEALLASRAAELDRLIAGLKDVVGKAQRELGSPTEALAQYQGKTREHIEGILANLASASLFHGNASAVLAAAQRELERHPIANLISKEHFAEAIRALSEKPITLDPALGLAHTLAAITPPGGDAWRAAIHEAMGDVQTLQARFPAIMDKLVAERAAADKRIGTVVSARENGAQELNTAKQAAPAARAAAERVLAAGVNDGLFQAPSAALFIGAAEKKLTAAAALLTRDPAGAMAGPGKEGIRGIAQAQDLLAVFAQVREGGGLLEKAAHNKRALAAGGLSVAWVDPAVRALSDAGEAHALRGQTHDVGAELKALRASVVSTGARLDEAVALNAERTGPLVIQQATAQQAMSAARTALAKQLGLAERQVLLEAGRDPRELLDEAGHHQRTAKEALDSGDTAGARRALDDAKARVSAAMAAVEDSLSAVKAYPSALAERSAGQARLPALIAEQENTHAHVMRRYAPSALQQATPRGSPATTLANCLEAARSATGDAARLIQSAEQAFPQGRVLEAQDKLAEGAARHADAHKAIMTLVAGRATLDELAETNASALGRMSREADGSASRFTHVAVQSDTKAEREKGVRLLADARAASSDPSDPFAVELLLGKAKKHLSSADRMLSSNMSAYEEAEEALESARRRSGESSSGFQSALALFAAGNYAAAASGAQQVIAAADAADRAAQVTSGGGGDFGGGGAGGSWDSSSSTTTGGTDY